MHGQELEGRGFSEWSISQQHTHSGVLTESDVSCVWGLNPCAYIARISSCACRTGILSHNLHPKGIKAEFFVSSLQGQ
jgi:hypothetical protein